MQGFGLYGKYIHKYLTVKSYVLVLLLIFDYFVCFCFVFFNYYFNLKSHFFSFLMFGTYFISLPLSLPHFSF